MKNNKLIQTASSAALLMAASFSNATIYEITYTYQVESTYTSSQPLHPSGTPDGDGNLGPGGDAVHNIPPTPLVGTGKLDTESGEIALDPIDFEVNVTGGSYGYVGWSQTLTGVFNNNIFSMTVPATVDAGSSVCEDVTSTACTNPNVGGEGQLPPALQPPQLYTPGTSCGFGCTTDPTTTPIDQVVFDIIETGGVGQYLHESDVEPDFTITTINMTIGQVIYAPIPAAAWMFGSALLGLAAVIRRKS